MTLLAIALWAAGAYTLARCLFDPLADPLFTTDDQEDSQ